MARKTRVAYGTHRETGNIFILGDTIDLALKSNMMVKDYEEQLAEINPQLDIVIMIEPV